MSLERPVLSRTSGNFLIRCTAVAHEIDDAHMTGVIRDLERID